MNGIIANVVRCELDYVFTIKFEKTKNLENDYLAKQFSRNSKAYVYNFGITFLSIILYAYSRPTILYAPSITILQSL